MTNTRRNDAVIDANTAFCLGLLTGIAITLLKTRPQSAPRINRDAQRRRNEQTLKEVLDEALSND